MNKKGKNKQQMNFAGAVIIEWTFRIPGSSKTRFPAPLRNYQ